jgi:hypothetical protein
VDHGYVITYDANGNQTESIQYHRDSETNEWVGEWHEVSVYDVNGNQTEYIQSYWDSEIKDWVRGYRRIVTYDANGNQTESNSYWWDSETNEWVGSERRVNVYDAKGNQTEYIGYTWDTIGNDWVRVYRWTGAYDANGNKTDLITYSWDTITNDWVYEGKWIYYWSELTTSSSCNNKIDRNYNFYPNPTQGILIIETGTTGQHSIEITSLNGKLLYTDKMEEPTHHLDLSSFQTGVYFITVRSRDYVRTEKIIKQ